MSSLYLCTVEVMQVVSSRQVHESLQHTPPVKRIKGAFQVEPRLLGGTAKQSDVTIVAGGTNATLSRLFSNKAQLRSYFWWTPVIPKTERSNWSQVQTTVCLNPAGNSDALSQSYLGIPEESRHTLVCSKLSIFLGGYSESTMQQCLNCDQLFDLRGFSKRAGTNSNS